MPSKVDQNSIRRRGAGLIASDPEKVSPGYVLVAPLTSKQVHLVDTKGDTVHTWTFPWRNGRHARLLPNGKLAVNSIDPETPRPFWFFNKYGGGIMSEVDPASGDIVCQHRDPLQHHDAHHYGDGSGRILYTTLEKLSEKDSLEVQGGHPGTEAPDGAVYADMIKEVDANGKTIFEWKASQHLDRATFPLQSPYPREHWPLINSVQPLADGNILASLRSVSAVIIISREDGSVLWHLDSKVVAQQYCANELPGSGNILIFDNGAFRYGESFQYSRALEVDRSTKEIVWQWTDPSKERFYSPFMGGAQRLPSPTSAGNAPGRGNTLLTESAFGRIVEIDDEDNVCWEWINPHFAKYEEEHVARIFPAESNALFRAYKYPPELFPWLESKQPSS
ncbi:related to Ca2+-transporting ATPase [Sporisorium scitamineum]|uniref:Related to Ca2+-transporting ATPase n=4 Tax=Sporisorium scitamineum TaxID=49012 RepID=A0A127ZID8_9BASI|nr:related to Ca2+-transporting ATPase [Sporisorium scitamineum]